MTAPVDRPPTTEQQDGSAPEVPDTSADWYAQKRGIEDRSWLLFACVLGFILLAFAGMVVLTALGGGTTYVPWGD
jgi:hypothetical protein